MDTVIVLHAALDVSGGPPKRVHLTPAGTFRGLDGRGPYRIDDPAAVALASMAGGELPIDENHSIDLAAKLGGPSPARGWITAIHAEADGLWGEVRWTGTGRALLEEQAYRGISPALAQDASGKVLRVLRAGLTNTPNLPLTALHHQQEPSGMDDLTHLREALGLPKDATLAACVAAAVAATKTISTHAAELGRLAEAAGAAKGADAGAIITVLHARSAAGGEVDRLAKEIVSLNTQLVEVRNGQARKEAEAVIDAAIKAGKPITALREHYVTRHMADAKGVELELAAMVSLHSGGLGSRPRAPGADPATPTAEEREVGAKMGVDPVVLAKRRQEREAAGGGG